MCERCGAREAARFELTVFGPVDLREGRFCVPCHDEVVAASTSDPTPPADSFAYLGPIDFEVLRASLRRAEAAGIMDRFERGFLARELPRIAAAHGQILPPDLHDFVVRNSD